jgi:hypothetical protein
VLAYACVASLVQVLDSMLQSGPGSGWAFAGSTDGTGPGSSSAPGAVPGSDAAVRPARVVVRRRAAKAGATAVVPETAGLPGDSGDLEDAPAPPPGDVVTVTPCARALRAVAYVARLWGWGFGHVWKGTPSVVQDLLICASPL